MRASLALSMTSCGIALTSFLALPVFGCSGSSSPVATTDTGNLILNGDAESGAGGTEDNPVTKTPDWTSSGGAGTIQYGDNGIGYAVPGAPDPGKSFFSGGSDNDTSSLTQTIDVSKYASAIDGDGVTYALEAYLGGYAGQGDSATLTITFKSASGSHLGTGKVGPVTEADRKGNTELLKRSTTGAVPATTRSVEVVLSMTKTDGAYNDGYADDLSLVLDGV
jgi:hypothetical protein